MCGFSISFDVGGFVNDGHDTSNKTRLPPPLSPRDTLGGRHALPHLSDTLRAPLTSDGSPNGFHRHRVAREQSSSSVTRL